MQELLSLAGACRNYNFSYIALWLKKNCNVAVNAKTIYEVLDPKFVLERKLMETDIDFVREKVLEIKKTKRWKICCEILYPDEWPDGTWRIWLMNRLKDMGISPQVPPFSGYSEQLYEFGKTARSKIFETPLYPTPINQTAAKVSGIKKKEKNLPEV